MAPQAWELGQRSGPVGSANPREVYGPNSSEVRSMEYSVWCMVYGAWCMEVPSTVLSSTEHGMRPQLAAQISSHDLPVALSQQGQLGATVRPPIWTFGFRSL